MNISFVLVMPHLTSVVLPRSKSVGRQARMYRSYLISMKAALRTRVDCALCKG